MLGDLINHILDIIGELFSKEEVWVLLILVVIGGGVLLVFLPSISWAQIWHWILVILAWTWWLWVFLILRPIFTSIWLFWRQELFKNSIKFVLLELRIPREVNKSPQAMEQVLKSMHSLRNVAGDIREKWWDGEVTRWFGLEMVSFGGEIHLYARVYAKQRNLVEAAFFSFYPDVEIAEVEDYAKAFPATTRELYERNLELWGTEMILKREDAYPIKMYPDFEHEAEEKQFDPISTFLEVLAKIKKEEIVGIQMLIAPLGPEWREEWTGFVKKLQEPALMTLRAAAKIEDEEGAGMTTAMRQVPIMRTPGQTEILEAVEQNLSKPAFATLLRFIYLSPKDMFYDSFARRGLVGSFRQYAALNLNDFIQNYPMSTRTRIWNWPHIFPKWRNDYRKQRLLYNYRKREVPPETWWGRLVTSKFLNWNFSSKRFAMNVEGVATLFHPPTAVVLTAPHIRRVESRKAGPPAGLAIFGGEEEVDKFK